jgi:D-alanyl-lipoteichoic acid acyltransferase DltB (MBOAT superfamily)
MFFLAVFGACLLLEKRNEQKKWLLLAASYYFYMSIDWRFSLLLLALTAINYIAGSAIAAQTDQKLQKAAMAIAILLSLAILFYFKYANFFISQVAGLLNFGFVDREQPLLNVVLPVGISFMTFQAITYPIDMYAGRFTHKASALDFSLFMAFFPQLLSGPIVRAAHFIPQLEDNAGFNGQHMMEGIFMIVRGLVKKIMIADILALYIVDPAFDNPGAFSSAFLLVAALAFSFQVYADLSGYTDIALGTGRMLGYKLPINFNRPYLATSIANYWQRWHISMSSFFRDYLYEAIASWSWCNLYVKLLIVFMAIGLWHGAGWNFILYGFIHGALVGFEHYQNNLRREAGLPAPVYRGIRLVLRIAQIFLIVSLTRILFRGDDLSESLNYFETLLTSDASGFPLSWNAAAALALAAALHFTPVNWRDKVEEAYVRLPSVISAGGTVILMYTLTAVASGTTAFIYFQF